MSLLSNCNNAEFRKIVQESSSIAECERKLGYNSISGSVGELIKKRIAELSIDISHFTKYQTERKPENIFIENSTASQRTLRKYYLLGKYTKYICSICGQEPLWNGKELTLILDHVNGINNDDRLENLRWVCPNCNQQLDTTGSKNIKHHIKKTFCADCGVEISINSTRCQSCSAKAAVKIPPITRDELKKLIRETPFSQIGRKYGVSDNAIRKWCIKYGLPSKVGDIKKISNEVWADI